MKNWQIVVQYGPILKPLVKAGLISGKMFIAFDVWNYWRQLNTPSAMQRITDTAEEFGISERTTRRYIRQMEAETPNVPNICQNGGKSKNM